MIRKLLIANRGEIAVRVIRAAREMGILTVAVYSEADTESMHVRLADEAVLLGPAESSLSYLDGSKVIAAAKATGADAIHPGYGFLSERAEFAQACVQSGITFVGPTAAAMRLLGSKIEAKQLAVAAGVSVTPGYFEPGADANVLKQKADEIGYPIMLKASAGGGGRGMRVVRHPSDFDDEFRIASDEALKGFGDGAMMVEKLIERPRHVEVQMLADQHGNVACLFERECSLQRRHQKVVEEAPSPIMTKELWTNMRAATVALAVRAGYSGAGTAEFMVDEHSGAFYFLEVNARLQVEHPITEAITGLDLVSWQLRIAQGEVLKLDSSLMEGSRDAIYGHSIEARIVAEDPSKGFLPSIGSLIAWAEPKSPGIRVDTGFGPGATISRYYDSLLAKVIAHAPTRLQAIDRLRVALMDFHVLGVRTNIGYLIDILKHEGFREGNFDTGFLGREFPEWQSGEVDPMVGAIAERSQAMFALSSGISEGQSGAWGLGDDFRNVR